MGGDAVVDRPPGQVRRSQPRGRRRDQGDERDGHPAPVGAKQAEQPAQLPGPLALAADQPPQLAEEQERPHQAPGLVGLVLGLLGDVRPLGLRVELRDRVVATTVAIGSTGRLLVPRVLGARGSQPRHLLAPLQVALQEHRVLHARARRSPRTAGSARAARRDVPRSTIRPPSITTTSSASEIVDIRWATMNVVLPGHRLAQAALDRRLGLRVHRRGRVVEDQDPRVGEQRPGDRDPLALAARERQPALADQRLVAVGEAAR